MKILILFILLFISPSVSAQSKFWVSNKIEVGYDKIFISDQVTYSLGKFTKNGFATGLKFKLSNNTKLKTFYLLENTANNNWKNNHFLGIKLDLKLR